MLRTLTGVSRRSARRAPGQLSLGLVEDAGAIRDLLIGHIRRESPTLRLVAEMGVCQGEARIDLVAIGDELFGYEIKSQRDDLSRLPNQVVAYGSVFDRLTLVAPGRHLHTAAQRLPGWWGLALVQEEERGIEWVRDAGANPEP